MNVLNIIQKEGRREGASPQLALRPAEDKYKGSHLGIPPSAN